MEKHPGPQLSGLIHRGLVLVALTVAVLTCARGAAADGGTGMRLYRSYCASCHGSSGKGDGADAGIFTPPPPDLRQALQRYSVKELVRRLRSGQHLSLRLDPQRLRAQAVAVEDLLAYLRRLPTINWRLADRGQELYLSRCEDCHGVRGKPVAAGTDRPVPHDLSDPGFQASTGDAALVALVRHGRKGMPALIPRITEADGRALAGYVRLFSAGFDTYSRYCANCHGDDGRGRSSLGEVMHPPAVVFDRAYFARRDPERLRVAIWHMAEEHQPQMPHYRGVLSTTQARAIATYLRARD